MAREVKITLKRPEVLCMAKLYKDSVYDYSVDDDDAHGQLLKEHIVSLEPKFRDLQHKAEDMEKQAFKLKLSGTEAMAFLQTWSGAILHFDPFTNFTMQRLINEIHQQSTNKKVKALIRYENR